MRFVYYTFLALVSMGLLSVLVALGGTVYAISYFSRDLPDYNQLKDYQPPVVTRLYAGDGRLLAEYAEEKRVYVPIEAIPEMVRHAFVSAEDQNFYTHKGVDFIAVTRAIVNNLKHAGKGRRPEGASTITQQVAKNFLLGNEVSYRRKIREAILAWRMEKAMSKDQLLELYLNEIYLGGGSYGVAAAALNYFNKGLEELSIEEAAYLAALPKAPNSYHPSRNYEGALSRRNYVIDRMAIDGYITDTQAEIARAKPLELIRRDVADTVSAPYFAEEVRRELIEHYGAKGLYEDGLAVRTSVDPRFQAIAEKALRDGLCAYDRRHGWRGPIRKLDTLSDWASALAPSSAPPQMPEGWGLAVILSVKDQSAEIGLPGGGKGTLSFADSKWAVHSDGALAGSLRGILESGDVIAVEPVAAQSSSLPDDAQPQDKQDKDAAQAKKKDAGQILYALRQIPKVQGSLIALDPHTGRVLAMQGGWKYWTGDEFNRATQAWRQPGSAFKPFVYLPALDQGFTPSTLVLDAPFVAEQRPGVQWAPTNYSHEFYGPTPLRVGLEKSRNLMTVRLADHVGMQTVVDYAKRFGVVTDMKPFLANALGATETTLLRLTAGYAQFVNGGERIEPTFIDRIQDRRGNTVFRHDARPCAECGNLIDWVMQPVPEIPDTREQIADPRTAYQMVSMLEGVVQRGTAARLKSLDRPLAGKTGTTNESKDTWFIGFSPDLVVGVFVGYDEPKSLGKKETGASVAVPVFRDFIAEALKDVPPMPFRVPPGMRQVMVDPETGERAWPGEPGAIWESFIAGTEPGDRSSYILDDRGLSQIPTAAGSGGGIGTGDGVGVGTGGIY